MRRWVTQRASGTARAFGFAPVALFCLGLLAAAVTAAPAEHWAFRPVQKLSPPPVENVGWVQTPVDRFILAKLEATSLAPAPPADRDRLVRRVYLGLTGLPPTPTETDAFMNDSSPDAFDRLIARLLDSPHYGERWARHWLDLARYAESDGFELDAIRPHTWRYRDYVIRAFNEDKPYDQFIREQLAGDELWPNDPAALTATGFNLLGPDMVDSADQTQRRLNTLNDMTDTAASAFLGLSLGCARCHDHKFEPLTQRDYFAFQAHFAPAEFQRDRPVPTAAEQAAFDIATREYDRATRPTREAVEALERPVRERLYDAKLANLSEDVQQAHRTPKERRTPEQEGTVLETAAQVKITDGEVTAALTLEEKARRDEWHAVLKRTPKPAALPRAMTLQGTNGPARTRLLHRGDYNDPRDEVAAAAPAVLAASCGTKSGEVVDSPRARLAGWIASEANPLTARIMVNRLWQHHFGRALVATPSDFGTRGAVPSHPELLDWLASEFVRSGWSLKAMHRLMVRSAAYQQSTTPDQAAAERDPENQLFSRQNRVRLEGEAIRDSLLYLSGTLQTRSGGPGVWPPLPASLSTKEVAWQTSPDASDHARRSIYLFARRNFRFPFLEVLDAPDSNSSCPERGRDASAPQALTLLNSTEVAAAARSTAQRVEREASTPEARVRAACRLILGRAPTPEEAELGMEFLKDSPLSEFCRALFNLNDFVYVD